MSGIRAVWLLQSTHTLPFLSYFCGSFCSTCCLPPAPISTTFIQASRVLTRFSSLLLCTTDLAVQRQRLNLFSSGLADSPQNAHSPILGKTPGRWPASTNVVVQCSSLSITKWAVRISRKGCRSRFIKFYTDINTDLLHSHIGYDVTSYFRLAIIDRLYALFCAVFNCIW